MLNCVNMEYNNNVLKRKVKNERTEYGMTKEEIRQQEESIKHSYELLAKGLFLPEDASQLRRMIAYQEEKIAKAKAENKF
jgi:hypothetical protein